MADYLSYTFEDSPESASTFDELPLWSAPFGLLMLEHLELRRNLTVVDIGSGTGFPLLELAGRLGSSCQLFGVDPWHNASERARQKVKNYGLANVTIIERSAEQLPFEPGTVDLIVSNLGINNFNDPSAVFAECWRMLKSGGRLSLTTNLDGHWQEFYDLFETVLRQQGRTDVADALVLHRQHRGTPESLARLYTENGFAVRRSYEGNFQMKFVDGSAFLNHHFVKLGWLASWKSLLPPDDLVETFTSLEARLNAHSAATGGLALTVPMIFIEGKKL